MRIALTGCRGFIGRNLQVRLQELGHRDLVQIPHDTAHADLAGLLTGVEFVFHLAGVNRPKDPAEFAVGNHAFTQALCAAMAAQPQPPRVIYASSTQAVLDNPYGRSKREAEDELLAYGERTGAKAHIFRLTNVFGKWSRPNYNSAVATFCHNVARGEPIAVNDASAPLKLIYVDDVVHHFVAPSARPPSRCSRGTVFSASSNRRRASGKLRQSSVRAPAIRLMLIWAYELNTRKPNIPSTSEGTPARVSAAK